MLRKRKKLLDTGPLVAFFSEKDADYAWARDYFNSNDAMLLTTWPVITETCHFVTASARRAVLGLIHGGVINLVDVFPGTGRMSELMDKYSDQEPDLADISLVYAAEVAQVSEIITLDRKDFAVYRINGRKRFDIIGPP